MIDRMHRRDPRASRLMAEFRSLQEQLHPEAPIRVWCAAEELVTSLAGLAGAAADEEAREIIVSAGYVSFDEFVEKFPERGPDRYLLAYRCKGVHHTGEGSASVVFAERHYVEVVYPPSYPTSEPLVVAHSMIWHPNIRGAFLCKADRPFAVSVTLPMICDLVGRMIQYLHYNLKDDANLEAVAWARKKQQAGELPLDHQAILVDLEAFDRTVGVSEPSSSSDLVELVD